MIMRNDGSLIDLQALKFYDLENEDQIMLGTFSLRYCNCNDEIVESSEEELLVERKSHVKVLIPPTDSEDSQELVPATEDVLQSFDTELENKKLDDVEIPETQDIFSQQVIGNNEIMETQSFSDDISVDVKMTQEIPVETQPFYKVPPATRNFMKQQNSVKPPTRSLNELDETQVDNYNLETQPFVMPKWNASHSKKSLTTVKAEPPNLYERRSASSNSSNTQKMNSILMSSSEEEEEDEKDSEEAKISKNLTQYSETPSNSPLNMDILLNTPEGLPRLSSQLLINSDFIDRVNCSQPNLDETILEFKAEEEEVATLTTRTSFKRHVQFASPDMPKKRFKKKIMKYGSDDDDD